MYGKLKAARKLFPVHDAMIQAEEGTSWCWFQYLSGDEFCHDKPRERRRKSATLEMQKCDQKLLLTNSAFVCFSKPKKRES